MLVFELYWQLLVLVHDSCLFCAAHLPNYGGRLSPAQMVDSSLAVVLELIDEIDLLSSALYLSACQPPTGKKICAMSLRGLSWDVGLETDG